MGRRRTFIESEAISSATAVFAERGFAGASVDDLVRATGVNRASLYGVFGSKDGLFQRCLTEALAALSPADTSGSPADAAEAGREELDLILVALMEIAPGDPAVRDALITTLHQAGVTAEALGRRLLERAGAATSSPATPIPTASASPPT
ncbi:TetR/AcrR family transcriptional regulator [Actinomyces oris]|uniref:Helix-turn-helix domain-containing protein n=1 Tax=Actinomyces oris TaxID=544580 RepID=A0AAW9KRN9_9ACTO|nr:TetR/AcrR family transcriptional regulator [Actinomyces oris]MEA1304754.1 helix-turn-helix domain-containing protein [Actinomyces oris]OLO66863.1 TetR family transcriptional regulator [Actinomyces oris]